MITARGFWTRDAATVSSKGCSVGLRSKVGERSVGGRWRAERVCTTCAAMAASGAAAGLPRRLRSNGMMCEAAHTMCVPRGTRGPARTSPCRSNEASPTLTMMVDEQLPPARTVTGGAGGRGIAGFSRPFGLTLGERGGFVRAGHGYRHVTDGAPPREYRLFR